jgi:hypothetical protein
VGGSPRIVPTTIASPASFTRRRQVNELPVWHWEVSYRFHLLDDVAILNMQSFITRMNGMGGTALVPAFSGTRVPWPLDANGREPLLEGRRRGRGLLRGPRRNGVAGRGHACQEDEDADPYVHGLPILPESLPNPAARISSQ